MLFRETFLAQLLEVLLNLHHEANYGHSMSEMHQVVPNLELELMTFKQQYQKAEEDLMKLRLRYQEPSSSSTS